MIPPITFEHVRRQIIWMKTVSDDYHSAIFRVIEARH